MKLFFTKILAVVLFMFCISVNVWAQEQVRLSIVPGKNWKGTMRVLLFPKEKTPQIAAWIETPEGVYVSTLFASSRASKKDWYGSPQEGRPESLPVWYHALNRTSSGSSASDIDAVTSATPSGEENLERAGGTLIAGQEYIAYIEVNHSFDYNDEWPKKVKKGQAQYSGVNGQPSVVYAASFIAATNVAGTEMSVPFTFIGQGSVDGSDGNIISGRAGLTSALSIIESASIISLKE